MNSIPDQNRIKELKGIKKLANKYLSFYCSKSAFKHDKWKKGAIQRNILTLKDVITIVNGELHPTSLTDFNALNGTFFEMSDFNNEIKNKFDTFKFMELFKRKTNTFFLLMNTVYCSPNISYFNDLTWFRHGTVKELIDYALGKSDESIFEKYLETQMKSTCENEFTYLKHSKHKNELSLLQNAMNLIEKGYIISANILIVTLIEGLVRMFCFSVRKKQNPLESELKIREFISSKQSLELLINDSGWKRDIPISISSYIKRYNYYIPCVERKAIDDRYQSHISAAKYINDGLANIYNQMIVLTLENKKINNQIKSELKSKFESIEKNFSDLASENEKSVKINLSVFLGYLNHKYKHDRNNIIHGEYSNYGKKWNTLYYLSALGHLIEKIKYYEENAN